MGCIDAAVIMWSSNGKMNWARIFDTWKLTKNRRALPLKLNDN